MNQPKPQTPEAIANRFAETAFTDSDLERIQKTRRRTPRLGEAPAQVFSFRAPPSYKERIKQRAVSDRKTESDVIRDALDAYLG